jgi:hypothetical protein
MYHGTTSSRAEKAYKYWALAPARLRFEKNVPIEIEFSRTLFSPGEQIALSAAFRH